MSSGILVTDPDGVNVKRYDTIKIIMEIPLFDSMLGYIDDAYTLLAFGSTSKLFKGLLEERLHLLCVKYGLPLCKTVKEFMHWYLGNPTAIARKGIETNDARLVFTEGASSYEISYKLARKYCKTQDEKWLDVLDLFIAKNNDCYCHNHGLAKGPCSVDVFKKYLVDDYGSESLAQAHVYGNEEVREWLLEKGYNLDSLLAFDDFTFEVPDGIDERYAYYTYTWENGMTGEDAIEILKFKILGDTSVIGKDSCYSLVRHCVKREIYLDEIRDNQYFGDICYSVGKYDLIGDKSVNIHTIRSHDDYLYAKSRGIEKMFSLVIKSNNLRLYIHIYGKEYNQEHMNFALMNTNLDVVSYLINTFPAERKIDKSKRYPGVVFKWLNDNNY